MELDNWIHKTGDNGEIPEDAVIEATEKDNMIKAYNKSMLAKGLSPDISDEDYLQWWEKKLLGK